MLDVFSFLLNNKDLLQTNNFDALYERAAQEYEPATGTYAHRMSDITYVLLKAGIDPLQRISFLPEDFYANNSKFYTISITLPDTLVIPPNVKTIDTFALFKLPDNVTSLVISDGCNEIVGNLVYQTKLKSITLPANIQFSPYAFAAEGMQKFTIHCSQQQAEILKRSLADEYLEWIEFDII